MGRGYWVSRAALAGLYCALVFIVCTVAVPHTVKGALWSDKAQHLLAFFVLEILIARAYTAWRDGSLWRAHRFALAFAIGYGGVIELWQGLLPWRSMELLDWIADAAGSLVGAIASLLWYRVSQRRPCK